MFSRFRRFRNRSKNRCGKKGVKMVVRGTSCSTKGIQKSIKPAPGAMRSGAGGYHFKRFPSEENREESQQKGANKVECKRHMQKGKCRQGTHDARKHARWPAAACGFKARVRIPPGQVFVFVGLWVRLFGGVRRNKAGQT